MKRHKRGSGVARRTALYDYIVEYKTTHGGETPRLRDMMTETGLASPSVVHYHLRLMADEGLIRLVNDGGKMRHIAIPGECWRPRARNEA